MCGFDGVQYDAGGDGFGRSLFVIDATNPGLFAGGVFVGFW